MNDQKMIEIALNGVIGLVMHHDDFEVEGDLLSIVFKWNERQADYENDDSGYVLKIGAEKIALYEMDAWGEVMTSPIWEKSMDELRKTHFCTWASFMDAYTLRDSFVPMGENHV